MSDTSFDPSFIIVMLIMLVWSILGLVRLYLRKRWSEELLSEEFIQEMLKLYKQHKRKEEKKVNPFVEWWNLWMSKRRASKDEKEKYGVHFR